MMYERHVNLKPESTQVTLERSHTRPFPAVCGWIPARVQSRAAGQRPRPASWSLHTAAWCTADRSGVVVTQQCFECHTHHWTTAFVSFLLSVHAYHVKTRREEEMDFGCHTLRPSRVWIILLLN